MKNKVTLKKATIKDPLTKDPLTKEGFLKLKNQLNKEEMLLVTLSFAHCMVLLYKAAKIEIPDDFNSLKEARRLIRLLRKQGRDKL